MIFNYQSWEGLRYFTHELMELQESCCPLPVTSCVQRNCSQPWIFAHTAFRSFTHPPIAGSSASSLAYVHFWTPNTSPLFCQHQIKTHRMIVCFVYLDRQGVPWTFGDNFLVKLFFFSFHVWKNKLASLQFLPLPCLISCCGNKSTFCLFVFLSPQHTHNQSAYKPTFLAQILQRRKK